ncbi:hypothetical protein EF847_15500 [Actinobacteria bacterium YIM 96077]|uniref:Polymerase/histidinol phosphatase N-terminal domain-containing protein n=1 Tax=Phytoactinopolyspora halophila TaxID=1981511 RepID=A0A329QT51_9ACTN|nr:CehA/McbA family metallohydrolase [Phytoactinopolyspora halophila]AYY13893.1 hypothetical protein EF847_15500 [Actinobacteria bacterium YIM 96077]RAW15564.1 hypothetical protein DPM12_07840 [Phytoactinopolyspora halophila]
MTTRIERTLTPDDRAETPYLTIPFEIGPGTSTLEVRLSYDRGSGVIDLGCAGADGFRGWSGGNRERYVITPEAATPGYLPGELEPGTWSVVLGLHRIPAAGLDVTVEIDVPASGPPEAEPPAPPLPERPPRRRLPADSGRTWLACDFHAHTVHSDGALGRAGLAALAVQAGLDVLAVTDHNTVSHHDGLGQIGDAYGITLVPGQEVTTDRGHANAFGAIPWIDFRQPPDTWVSQVAETGGLLSINHPLAADCAWHHPLAQRPPLAEIWHWSWLDTRWTGPLSWWNAWGWDTIPVGGSDFHAPEQGRPIGVPVTWVAVDDDVADRLTARAGEGRTGEGVARDGDRTAAPGSASDIGSDAVLAALRAGRTAVAAGRDGPALLRVDGELVAVDAKGTLLTDTLGRRRPVHDDLARFPATSGPHWLETPDAAVLAITP